MSQNETTPPDEPAVTAATTPTLSQENGIPEDDTPVNAVESPESPIHATDSSEDTIGFIAQEALATSASENEPVLSEEQTPLSLLDFEPRSNVTQTSEVRAYNSKDTRRPKQYDDSNSLAFVNGTETELDEHAQRNYPNISITRGDQGGKWAEAISQARRYLMTGDALLGSVLAEDSDWRQSVTAGAEQLQAGRPRFEGAEDGGKLSGEQAMMKLQSVLGLGAIVRIPLWHSGMWICLKAPTEAALLELDRRIGEEKIRLGRRTNGLVYSNTSIYIVSYLVNFALAHVYEATYKFTQESTRENELKSVILSSDIPTLIWGLLCTMYPNGYPHREPCVRDPTHCLHVVEEMLNIGKLSWTNERALTDAQRRHMQRKTAKFTAQELTAYRDQHSYMQHRTVKLHEKLSMEMRVPTIREYEEAGFGWVDGIVQQIDRSYGNMVDEDRRNDFISEQGMMTALRQYVHWVDRLVLEGTTVIDDRSTLEDTLATLTSQEAVYEAFFEGVGKFIDVTTISLIALPKYDCPNCGKPMQDNYKLHPYLVPLDVVAVFFTLLDQRITPVLSKQSM